MPATADTAVAHPEVAMACGFLVMLAKKSVDSTDCWMAGGPGCDNTTSAQGEGQREAGQGCNWRSGEPNL
jgi:hypothetical protein